MKRTLGILFLSLYVPFFLSAQTIFWAETFGTGCNSGGNLNTSNGTWTITNTGANGADANTFIISAQENGHTVGQCGTSCSSNDMTLHIYSPVTGDAGAQYLNGGGGFFFPQSDQRCESPVVNCTGRSNITLKFNYLEFGDGVNDDAEVWYFDGSTWSLLANTAKTTCCGGACNSSNQGLWASYSTTLPASANNNPNVKIGFHWINNDDGIGNDPSFCVDSVIFSVTAALPVASITPSPNDTICQNATLTLNGSATNGPITAWAWTVSPSTGVVFNPDTANQNPTVTFTTAGTYTFTLQATNGSGSDTATQVITVLPMLTPSVVITANPLNPICAGATVTFTATPTNGGTTPSYQWQVNGVNVGTDSSIFSSSTLANGDIVSVTLTSNASCLTTASASDSYTVVVTSSVVPSVTITANDSSICTGTTVNFTASPTNGGSSPGYQWTINGANVGTNSPNFSSSTLNNNDTVRVILTSSSGCANPATATSDSILIVVTPTVVPSVSIAGTPANPVCLGQQSSFTATPTNGGAAPAYQWQVNGVNTGSNSPNFGPIALINGDTVSVTLTPDTACAIPASITAIYTVQVISPVAPSVTVSPDPAGACAGSSITFTATSTNGGTTPSYQWQLNGANAGTNSPAFTLNNVTGGEQVSVVLTSNATCLTIATISSNTVTVNVIAPPTISITHGTATVCPAQKDTLIATVTAGSSVTWSPAGGLNTTSGDTVTASNIATGIYTYYATATLNGCSSVDSVKVTVSNSFTATAGPSVTVCFGQPAPLSVTGGSSWTWTPSGTSCDACQQTTATPSVSTIYTVVAASGACTDTVTESVTVIPNASASFNTAVLNQGLPQTVQFNNASGNASGYYWTFGNDNATSVLQNPSYTYNAEGTYTVELIAYGTNGCNDTISTVLLISDTVGISVPNIFTPNGDEINDVWKPSVHGATSLECTIYNRWGIKVYEFANTQDHWDGYTTGGLPCQDGTYYYILKATDRNNKNYDFKGYLQLIH